MSKQKLSAKLKNTPRDVQSLLVSCSVRPVLNKVERPSVRVKVRTDNTPEGVHCKGKSLIVNKKSINIKHVESIYNTGSFIWRQVIPLTTKVVGFLA